MFIRQIIDIVGNSIPLVSLRPRVYYTLGNFRGGGGEGQGRFGLPSIRQCNGCCNNVARI